MKIKFTYYFAISVLFSIILTNEMNAQKKCSEKTTLRSLDVKPVSNTRTKIDFGDNYHPYGGTFQFIVSKDATKLEVFTDKILETIESNRLEDEENIIKLSPYTRVRILSKNQINNPNFQRFTELYTVK